MTRLVRIVPLAASLLLGASAWPGCGADGKAADTGEPAPAAHAAVPVEAKAAVEQPLARYIRATGSLTAEEQADVAAEIAGRIVATPVERGTPVAPGAPLVRISPSEAEAQAREAEANAAQLEARLGLAAGTPFEVNRVPEVQTAKAALDLAQSEFNRIESLLDQRVVSQSEFDQRRAQLEAARQQLEAARNAASQQFQALEAARARVALARKALEDTTVRAPFAGLVGERFVSVGDYVTKGMRVAVVVRVNPLRVQLTVPEQFVSAVVVGAAVTFQVDAFPGRDFVGTVRYVSPALETNRRALTVEAAVPNPQNELKPGLFATARIEQPDRTPGILVPVDAVQTVAGTSRVYVVKGDHVEERLVTIGQPADSLIEITNGLQAGEQVATKNVPQLFDGAKVS
ncbi:MAG: efflux RND transporter periplasmic adaptor subunit [Vicinamibacterales bacterium]